MKSSAYDEYADAYDQWFLKNERLFLSEAKLVAACLEGCGRTLSVGCGSGLFEAWMRRERGIVVEDGVEPSAAMAEIARKRGMRVQIATAEDFPADGGYDTVLFNGCPSYIADLEKAFRNGAAALKPGGRIVVADVPKESGYALIYNLALAVGTWDHPLLEGVKPPDPYPIEFVKAARWRTTDEKVEALRAAGFGDFRFRQTLTVHPMRADDAVEEPSEGCDRGSYVAITARRPG